MKFIGAILVIMLLVTITGCGGGGGGSTSIPLSDTIRAWQAGDEWVYRITGTVNDGIDTLQVSGTFTQTVSGTTIAMPISGTAHILSQAVTLTSVIDDVSYTDVSKLYFTQAANGTIWEHGGQDTTNGDYWITSPSIGMVINMPSPMTIGTSWGDQVEYSSGEAVDTDSTVTGTETVRVPAGTFNTYKGTMNGTLSGMPGSFTGWYAPQTGNLIKMVGTCTDSTQGINMNLTIELQSKNRAANEAIVKPSDEKLGVWLKSQFKK